MIAKYLFASHYHRYLKYLNMVTFSIGLCIVLSDSSLLCAGMQNDYRAKLNDKAVNSCGPQALRIAMSLLGHSVEISRCAELAGTDPNGVTTLAGLQSAAQTLGSHAKGMHLTPEELDFIGRPAILHVSLPVAKDHFMIFTSSNGGWFELIDPVQNAQKNLYTADQIRLMWKGNCIIFKQNPLLISLKAGIYRSRRVITVIIGIGFGVLLAVLIGSYFFRRSDSSVLMMTETARKSTISVLGCILIVSAFIMLFCMQRIRSIRYTEKDPRLILGTTVMNVGDLDWGRSFTSSIWIGNGGSGTLKIDKKKVMTSCTCLKAIVSKTELTEFEKSELKFRVTPPKKIGPFQYSMYIPSDDPHGGKILTVKGQVAGAGGVVYPPSLYFNRINDTKRSSKKLLYILRRPDVKILNVTSDLPFAVCTFSKRSAGAFEINVSLSELPKPGPFSGTVNILTNDPETEYAEIAVPFSGIVEPKDGNRLSAGLYN
jgi:hypothetical protein